MVAQADKIILPGVGHFSATAILEQTGLRTAILHRIEQGAPFLGICVGMQWMFESSAEAPGIRGLGLFSGACVTLSGQRQITACRLEFSDLSRSLAAASRDPFRFFRVLHPLVLARQW